MAEQEKHRKWKQKLRKHEKQVEEKHLNNKKCEKKQKMREMPIE